jgi:hypothetical protein
MKYSIYKKQNTEVTGLAVGVGHGDRFLTHDASIDNRDQFLLISITFLVSAKWQS